MTQAAAAPWDLGITARSVPSGMPLPDEETGYSDESRRALAESAMQFGPGEAWLPLPTLAVSSRMRVSPPGPGTIPQVIRYESTPAGITSAAFLSEPTVAAGELFAEIDSLKPLLGVDVDELLGLLDVRRRTFYTWRDARTLPVSRFAEIQARVNLLLALVRDDPATTRTLVTTRPKEVAEALSRFDFDAVRDLWSGVADTLAAAGRSPRELALDALSARSSDVLDVVRQAGFEEAALAYAAVRGLGDARARVTALAAADAAVRVAHRGGDIERDWDFLGMLRHAEMDAVLERAHELALSPDFSGDRLAAFLEAERAEAWEAYSPVILPPDEVVPISAGPLPAPSWEPDLTRYGAVGRSRHAGE